MILELQLRLQFGGGRHFWRSRARSVQPSSDPVIGQLSFIADDRSIDVTAIDRPVCSDDIFGHNRGPIDVWKQRRGARRKRIRQHGEDCYAGIDRGSLASCVLIDGGTLADECIDIGDADHDLDISIRLALGDFDLIEIFRSVVVDRRPKQIPQIADFVGRGELWRMRADIRKLFLRVRRKIRLETVRLHDLPRDGLEIDGRRMRIVHRVRFPAGCLRLTRNLTDAMVSLHRRNARDILVESSCVSSDWIDSRSSLKIMISVSNVSMRYGAKILFDEVSTGFTPGKRYGLTGPNGAGKSTFMKLLTGELEPQKGTVVRPRKLGVLSQDQFAFDKYRVIDTVIMGNRRLWAALEEREIIYAKPR